MKKTQKTRLRLREYSSGGKKAGFSSIEQRRKEFDSKLHELSKKRARLSDELRQLSSRQMNLSQVSNAGMLAHYAVLAVLLGSMAKSIKKRFYEKELENLGGQHLDYETKLEELSAFHKAVEATEKAFVKYEKSSDAEKATHYDEFKKLSEKRDGIAQRLGLSAEEFTSLTNVIKEVSNAVIDPDALNEEQVPVDDIKESLKRVSQQITEIKSKYGDDLVQGDDLLHLVELENKRDALTKRFAENSHDVELDEFNETMKMVDESKQSTIEKSITKSNSLSLS